MAVVRNCENIAFQVLAWNCGKMMETPSGWEICSRSDRPVAAPKGRATASERVWKMETRPHQPQGRLENGNHQCHAIIFGNKLKKI